MANRGLKGPLTCRRDVLCSFFWTLDERWWNSTAMRPRWASNWLGLDSSANTLKELSSRRSWLASSWFSCGRCVTPACIVKQNLYIQHKSSFQKTLTYDRNIYPTITIYPSSWICQKNTTKKSLNSSILIFPVSQTSEQSFVILPEVAFHALSHEFESNCLLTKSWSFPCESFWEQPHTDMLIH